MTKEKNLNSLIAAAKKGNTQTAKEILDVIELEEDELEAKFIELIREGDLKTVQTLIEVKKELMYCLGEFYPLRVSANFNQAAIANLLLKKGGVRKKNPDLTLCIHLAIGETKKAETLLKKGFQVPKKDALRTLKWIVKNRQIECLKLFLSKTTVEEAEQEITGDALQWAFDNDKEDALKILTKAYKTDTLQIILKKDYFKKEIQKHIVSEIEKRQARVASIQKTKEPEIHI